MKYCSPSSIILASLLFTTNLAHAMSSSTTAVLETRLRNALYGMFAGDALAAPTHWYYGGIRQIKADYGPRGITGYTKPKSELSGSILNKSDPNGGGRMSHLSRQENVNIIGDVINHGKLAYWAPGKSIHYHATLQAGEPTLEMQIGRVLMRSIVANGGRFNEEHFRNAYVKFMMREGSHNDTYASTCHRMFFANLVFAKLDPRDCPDDDGHNVETVDGLVLPTITALAETARHLSPGGTLSSEDVHRIRQASARTAAVTRKSKMLESVAEVWSTLVADSLIASPSSDHREMQPAIVDVARKLGFAAPRSSGKDTMSACYLSQSLPPVLDMLMKYTPKNDVYSALLANANRGGENVHSGAVLGSILGARAGDEGIPSSLKDGLYQAEEIRAEIDSFVKIVARAGKPGNGTENEL